MTFHRIAPTTSDGDHDDRDRVNHRRLHVANQLDVLLDVDGQPFENGVEDAARLAGRHHVRVERVERFRVPFHAVGQRRAPLDVLAHLEDDRREVLVRLLLAKNVQTLHERQAGVDHDRELAGENRQALGRHTLARLGPARLDFGLRLGPCRLGGIDAGDLDLLAPERTHRRIHRVRNAFPGDRLPRSRAT